MQAATQPATERTQAAANSVPGQPPPHVPSHSPSPVSSQKQHELPITSPRTRASGLEGTEQQGS
eukprot:scaffold162528_cov14-Tisochrysis_lutea.AAC.1